MSELAVIGYDVHGCNIVEIVNKKQPDVCKPTVNLKEQETKPVYKREKWGEVFSLFKQILLLPLLLSGQS